MTVALSIRQPWIELILRGRKTIEVRTWSTRHRGGLWLHAGLRPDTRALRTFDLNPDDLIFGALLGRCELYDCIELNELTWERWRSRHLNKGPLERRQFGWMLRNPCRMAPVNFKGRLGLMRIED